MRLFSRFVSGLFTLMAVASALALPAHAADLSKTELAIVAAVDARADQFAASLEQAVLIDSATENRAGVRRVGALYSERLAALGFAPRWIEMPPEVKRAGHLFAERTGTKGKRLLLIGHLDTVLRGGAFRREGDKAFGSGTQDMKGGNLVVIEALRALHAVGALDDTRLIVAFTGDEESAGEPREISRRDLLEAARRSDLALAFENAIGATATVARRGNASWKLEVQGATGHSAGIFSPLSGSGAVFEAARILTVFHEKLRAEFPGLTFNPSVIVGGTEAALASEGKPATASGKGNVIAQRALVRGDLRFGSPEQLDAARARMRELIATGNLHRTSATITFEEGYPSMPPTPANLALLAQLDAVSRDLGFGAVEACDPNIRGAGDASFVAPILPCLDGLGARGAGAHAPNEEIDLKSLPELVKRTALLIYRLTR